MTNKLIKIMKQGSKENLRFYGLILVVLLVWAISWGLILLLIPSEEQRGQFGDQFGAVNALFSGLAFAMIIYTIFLQRRDLKLQRKDLKIQQELLIMQHQEMKETKEVFMEQSKTMRLQRFENTFFNLMGQYNDVKKEFKINESNNLLIGQEVLVKMVDYLDTYFGSEENLLNSIIPKEERKNIPLEPLEVKFSVSHLHGSVYWRILKQFLKMLSALINNVDHNTNLTTEEKHYYVEMIKNQLTDHEMIIIGYSMFHDFEEPINIKYLAKTYNFFDRYFGNEYNILTKNLIIEQLEN